jgi:enolase-phosphatase E1
LTLAANVIKEKPSKPAACSTILLDIEGTTTPIDFVYQVLFPYARHHAAAFLAANPHSTREDVAGLADENAADIAAGLDPPRIRTGSSALDLAPYVHWLMDRDRKSTPLKSLQGKIWEAGYRSGELRGQVFDDVPPALTAWRERGKRIAIYSSGSVLAQQLLFGSTEAGDLTRFIASYFDTAVGSKLDAASYRHISEALEIEPARIVFISDVTGELTAAQEARLGVLLSIRPGNPAQENASAYRAIHSFAEVEFLS